MKSHRSFHPEFLAVRAKGISRLFSVLAVACFSLLAGQSVQAASVGKIQFADVPGGYTPIQGFVNFKVSRVEGSAGAVSAVCFTKDDTAKAGVDYTALTQTVSWADGDAADKIFPVPFINRNLNDGTKVTFSANLKNPTGGAVIGTMPVATETILYPGQVDTTQPTVEISSPPADISVVTGTRVTLAADVSDPSGILSSVQFFLNGKPYGESTGSGPFTLSTVAPAPGAYVLEAVVIDDQGRQNSSTRTVTVLANDPKDPVPNTALYSDLGGRNLAGGSTTTLTATAASLSPDGTALAKVEFFADNTLIASYDGRGKLLKGSSGLELSGRRPAVEGQPIASAAPGAGSGVDGTVFTAAWNIPNLTKLVNLLMVATTQGGRSKVSAPITVQAVATTASSNKPPVAILKDVFGGTRARTGVKITIPVDVSDPDAADAHRETDGRRPAAFNDTPSGLISKMEFYLNQVKVATATRPPFSFDITPTTPGSYAIQAIATDGAGLAGVAKPLVVKAVSISPGVTIDLGTAKSIKRTVAGGASLSVVVRRVGDDLSMPLNVAYKASGSAVPRVNYKSLKGKVTIPAGKASVSFKVRTLANAATDGTTTLKLGLLPSNIGVYKLAKPSRVQVSILDK